MFVFTDIVYPLGDEKEAVGTSEDAIAEPGTSQSEPSRPQREAPGPYFLRSDEYLSLIHISEPTRPY